MKTTDKKIGVAEWVRIICLYSQSDIWVTRYSPRKYTVLEMLPEILQETSDADDEFPYLHMDKYKLLLRPLSSMEPEEIKESGIELDWNSMDYTDIETLMFTPTDFTYLLSKSFDLFNLIESGIAIDSTTIKK